MRVAVALTAAFALMTILMTTMNSMMTLRLAAGSAAPGPNRGTVRVLAIASVAEAVLSSAKFSLPQLALRR